MEALLSLSFDNLSSYEPPKIRKGLRQVEGLLAQICLSQKRPSQDRRRSMLSPTKQSSNSSLDSASPAEEPPKPQIKPKELDKLPEDPAYREFFKLQEGFEWNVALRLVGTLDRLLGKSNDGLNDLLILGTLDLIQGILLLHPPSRNLFGREVYMNASYPYSPLEKRGVTTHTEHRLTQGNSTYSTFSSPSMHQPYSPQPSSHSSSRSWTAQATPAHSRRWTAY